MRSLEPFAALTLFVLRLSVVSADWAFDGLSVLALFWGAVALSGGRPKVRSALLAGACLWLAALYAFHQGPHTFAIFRPDLPI